MRLAILTSLACMLLLTLAHTPGAEPKAKDSTYLPLKIGTKWHYRTANSKFTMQVAKHEKVADANCALIEMVKDGTVALVQHVAVKDDGIYTYSLSGQKPDAPVLMLKLPPKKGESWQVATRFMVQDIKGTYTAGEEEVVVPAGKYQALTVTGSGFQVPGEGGKSQEVIFKHWYAANVGLVKQTIRVGDRPEVVIELEKFELP